MALPIMKRRPNSGLGNIRSSLGSPTRNIDWVLISTVVILAVVGAFSIYSATFWKIDADPYWFATRQVVFLIVSAVVLAVVMSFDYTLLNDRAYFLYGVSVIALLLVLSAGALRGGARLSFDLGPISFQPA